MAYPDFNKVFEIYTDASSKQLGTVITQDTRPIAFFSRKLSDTQRKYSVTKIELLAIVETLKEFKGMLWGHQIKVFTDHANLMRDALCLTSDRVYQWRLLLEEYGPEIVYIKGIHNTTADAVSWLEYDPSVNKTAESFHMTKVRSRSHQRQCWATVSKNWCELDIDSDNLDSYTDKHDDWNLVFAHHEEEDEVYPLTLTEIADAQRKDQELKDYFKKNAIMPHKDMGIQLIEDTKVLCKKGKVVIPTSLCQRAVKWYHHYLQYPGHSRLEETMRSVMYWKGMCTTIWRHVKSCRSCQVNKRHSQKYGHLPRKLVITTPWKALCVDLIGPYTLKGKDGSSIDFMRLTMIDPATSWFEIVELPTVAQDTTVPPAGKGKKVTFAKNTKVAEPYFDKSSAQISKLVYKTWFSRYPRCHYIIYGNGSEFKLHFQSLCNTYGIKRKPTSVKNPQANAILERIHGVLGSMLRTSELNVAELVKAARSWLFHLSHHTCDGLCRMVHLLYLPYSA